jgi:endonuclease/exonuclease/phosphatase family metal-dependent hydrolase
MKSPPKLTEDLTSEKRFLMKRTILILLSALVCVTALGDSLRLMTFNVRYPSPDDGPNAWENRRDILVETIRLKNPDLIGTQELFFTQGEYIVSKLPDYKWFGLSRRGNHEDEHMGVFYKPSRLRLVESGNFWLSETPESPGSMSWNVSLPRMVTWALFEQAGGGQRFYFYNTHFPHRRQDEAARVECAKLIVDRIQDLPAEVPLILSGDFNAGINSDAHRILTGRLKDAWQETARKTGPTGTFNGFKGDAGGARIDWILYRGKIHPESVETVTFNRDGRYPSDHYPVFAVLDFK